MSHAVLAACAVRPKRNGFRRVTLGGRAWPSPEQAIGALRRALAKDVIEVPDEDVWAVLEVPGAICPYGAEALIPEGKGHP